MRITQEPGAELTQQVPDSTAQPASDGAPTPEQPIPVPQPARPPVLFHPHAADPHIRLEPLQFDFLMRLADALNTTLDLNTLMHRVADLVRAVIDYRIFAVLLLNERTHELWMRFQTGHTPEVERMRVRLGRGVVGQAAVERRSILVPDVRAIENYVEANPLVRSELAVPLIVKNKVIGVLDIESEQLGYFTAEHQRLLELTASRMAVAVENARLYTRVSRQAQTLGVLHEISREITSILDPDDLLERIGVLMKRVIDFQMFTILLWNERAGQLEHRFSTRYGERVHRDQNVRLGEGIIGAAAQDRTPILAPDVRKDARYRIENPETRSELAVPLLYKGRVIGVLDLEHTRLNYYNEDHLRTLTTLAAQVAVSIANAKLYQRLAEEEHRMELDLEMAREVQLRLLPAHPPPQPARAQIAVSFQPARSIGGDLYDFLEYGPTLEAADFRASLAAQLSDRGSGQLPDRVSGQLPDRVSGQLPDRVSGQLPDRVSGQLPDRVSEQLSDHVARLPVADATGKLPVRLGIALGDVSGKAAPAALYAALVSGLLRSLTAQRLRPAALLKALNDGLQERKLDAQYVTMLVALWNDADRTLTVANAGSVQPLLIRAASSQTASTQTSSTQTSSTQTGLVPRVSVIPAEGFPLGLFAAATYQEITVETQPGDTIVFFSDGIIDAANAEGAMFGTERLMEVLSVSPEANEEARDTVDAILAAVNAFRAGTEHFDDETVVVLKTA